MKLPICLSLTLAVAAGALGCSSSNSTTPGGSDDASTGSQGSDASTISSTTDSSTNTGSDDGSTSNSTTDSSTNTGSDDSSTGNSSTDSSTSSGGDAGAADAGALSFDTDIYVPIIGVHCVGCHSGSGAGLSFGKLDLSSADAGYANLVNVASTGEKCDPTDGAASPIRVIPGNAADSLLYEKVNGFTTAPPCGNAMPESGEIPDGGQAVVVGQIKTWINEGANP
jgi:hypothetical protein